ncbi:uncharacterized protein CcaverHIS019_0307230 [Cutaneotrichosporon cavernicola]|uniref:Uncharacterized protein n=1 Tax=Cutaneotrichosporon cavernicola TaxID=279322 RepID=A0AA48L2U7_9TREE|nr:uncharacterized protein CcaverHIS019_0307230 [Cutaneotrichosporon cavernicola]BEI90653.1 hypothetical protein CcaverHIS019_0307230 [Cutaneotrichosporon cavernicola]
MVAFALALAFAVSVYSVTVPITFDSYSLNAVYLPRVNGSLTETGYWNASFTDTPWSTRSQGTEGAGLGYHYASYNSSLDPPSVSYGFYGTGIQFFGYWGYLGEGKMTAGGSGETTLYIDSDGYTGVQNIALEGRSDQRPMKRAQPTLLCHVKDLPVGFYTVTLRVTSGTVSFTHSVIDVDFGATQPEIDLVRQNPEVRSPIVENALGESVRNDAFGNWSGTSWSVIPQRRVIGTSAINDSVVIDLGTGNYWMRLKGGRGYSGSYFRYSISPPPTMLLKQSDDLRTFAPWEVYNVSLLATTLDPGQRYNLTLTNLNNNGWDYGVEQLNNAASWFEIASLELWRKDIVPPPSKGLPIGVIVGSVVGGVFATIVGVAGVWWCVWGRWRRHGTISPAEGFEVDESPGAVSTPFVTSSFTTESGQPSYFPSRVPPMRDARGKRVSMSSGPGGEMSMSLVSEAVSSQKLRQLGNQPLSPDRRYSSDSSGTNLTRLTGATVGQSNLGISSGMSNPFGGDRPTFQGLDAGPIQSPMEVPPSYDPEWEPRARVESTARQSTATLMSSSAFVEEPQVLCKSDASPEGVELSKPNAEVDEGQGHGSSAAERASPTP